MFIQQQHKQQRSSYEASTTASFHLWFTAVKIVTLFFVWKCSRWTGSGNSVHETLVELTPSSWKIKSFNLIYLCHELLLLYIHTCCLLTQLVLFLPIFFLQKSVKFILKDTTFIQVLTSFLWGASPEFKSSLRHMIPPKSQATFNLSQHRKSSLTPHSRSKSTNFSMCQNRKAKADRPKDTA